MSIWIPVGITAAITIGWGLWMNQKSHASNYGEAIGEGIIAMFGSCLVVIVELVVWLVWALFR